MRALKHLPVSEWPEADREALTSAYEPGDMFEDTAGPGAHLSDGSRTMIQVYLPALARLLEGEVS